MRQLVIVCALGHAQNIKRAMTVYGHPEAIENLVDIFPVDMSVEIDHQQVKLEIMQLLAHKKSSSILTDDQPLLCATREPGMELGLASLARAMRYEYQPKNARELCELSPQNQGTSGMGRLLNRCGLGVRTFSAGVLKHWAHGQLDHNRIEQWIQQFGRLGKLNWLGEELLRNVRMVNAPQLGKMLYGFAQNKEAAICVNRDPRTTGKSGDVIANLLTKQAVAAKIHDSPAVAIDEHGHKKIILFEDGLWSGTEAIGVLESLLGLRDKMKLKTNPLLDPAVLRTVDITLAYGIATDYGESLVRLFLKKQGLDDINIVASERLQVADRRLIEAIGNGQYETKQLWDEGPPSELMKPHLITCLENSMTLDASKKNAAQKFCNEIGQQLFDNYLAAMQKLRGWNEWPEIKRQKCALGMHGLGLLHAFGHSVPRASSPLLWGSGQVTWNGASIDWCPLFENAAEAT